MQFSDFPDEIIFDILSFAADYRPVIAVVCRRWNDVICGRTNNGRKIPPLNKKEINMFLEEYCDYIDFDDDYFEYTISNTNTMEELIYCKYFKLMKRIIQTFRIKECLSSDIDVDYNKKFQQLNRIPSLVIGRIYFNMASNSKFHYNKLIIPAEFDNRRRYLYYQQNNAKFVKLILINHKNYKNANNLELTEEFKKLYIYYCNHAYYKIDGMIERFYFNSGDKDIIICYITNYNMYKFSNNRITINICQEKPCNLQQFNQILIRPFREQLLPFTIAEFNLMKMYKIIFLCAFTEKTKEKQSDSFINKMKVLMNLAEEFGSFEDLIICTKNNVEDWTKLILLNFLKKYIIDENKFYGSNYDEKFKSKILSILNS